MPEPIANQPFWAMSMSSNNNATWWNMAKKNLVVGPINHGDVYAEEKERRAQKYGGTPFNRDLWYDDFENIPIVKLPTSYHPDYFSNQGLTFISPRLFKLLDQPQGSLQGMPTDTIWFGPDYPDWEYLWLSFIPTHAAIDTSHCDPDDIEERIDPERGKVTVIVGFFMPLPLRIGLASPFGTFRAAESPATVLVSDAVALSVLRAGCTGLEFVHVETCRTPGGPHYRRGLHGPEIHPRQLEAG